MRKNLFLFVVAFFGFFVNNINAQITEVSGEQNGTWNGTVMLVGDVYVTDNLVIEPGTHVISAKNFSINVEGVLNAEGTADNMITFTVADTTGFADYETINGGWGGIEFRKSGDVVLKYCDFSYGKTPLGGNGANIRFISVQNAKVSNCVFHDNIFRAKGGGIYASHSNVEVVDCEAYNNQGYGYDGSYTYGGGFFFINCDVVVENIVSHDNYLPAGYGGGCSFDSCSVVLNKAVFYNNFATNGGGLGLQRSNHLDVKMSNVLAYNNEVIHYGGGMAMATASPELTNFTLVENICGGGGGAGMQVSFGSEPVINNSIIYGNHAIYADLSGNEYEYYYGSQIWLWGDDNWPVFQNGDVQYGLDSIFHNPDFYTEEYYRDMINEDPLFVDADNHNFRLTENSPCVDSGLADMTGCFVPETDLQGGPRIYNGRIDMGCYELSDFSVNEIVKNENDIFVAPNPLDYNSLCVMNMDRKTNAVIRLITLDGKEICKTEFHALSQGENVIPLGELIRKVEKANRMYLLVIDTQNNRYCKKVIY